MVNSIYLPTYFSVARPSETLSVCQRLLRAGEGVSLDASSLRFVDPFGLALFGATFYELAKYGRPLQVLNLSQEVRSYLIRMDALSGLELDGEPLVMLTHHDRSDSLVELTRIDGRDEVDTMAFRLAKALVGSIPEIDPNEPPDDMTGITAFDQLVEPIQYALCELLENAMTHGRKQGHKAARVWVASQYYPVTGYIRLGIVDTGCGFFETLKSHPALKIASDYEAILAALKPRISCNRDLRAGMESSNQGVGLTTTSRIFERARGSMVIVSGNGLYRTRGLGGAMQSGAHWQGVAIALQCKRSELCKVRVRDLLPSLEDTGPVKLRFE
jgi:anti-anti-sigma regulatory factor